MSDQREFNNAMTTFDTGDRERAKDLFIRITQSSPEMSDAWLGRIACGDVALETLAGAYANSRALGKELNRWQRPPEYLHGAVDTLRYINLRVGNRVTIALGYAAALINARRYDEALTVLDDPVVISDTDELQCRQFLQASLFHRTWRWPDVLAVTAVNPPAGTTNVRPIMIAAVDVLAAWANAHLGHTDAALALVEKVVKTITTADNPHIIADAWIVKGWCLRAKNDFVNAKAEFEKAVVGGKLTYRAQEALNHPDKKLTVSTAEAIATRTDKWDPRTETSDEARAAADLAQQRHAALGRAQTLLDGLIGLDKPKEEMRVWRTEIQIDQIFGDDTAKENHMVFIGPPGVGKTTFARVAAEVLFGLGITDRPEITEVTEEDLVIGYVSQTATRTKEVCEGALGGVLFIDEAPRLVPQTEGHSFGVEAIKTLNKYMEDYRDKLVVIVAGYADGMDRFLDADSGLRSRFNTTLTFPSYTPDEIEKIGRRIAERMKVVVADEAWPLLCEAAAELRGKTREHGTALDSAGNGRFARKVIRACKTERARRHCDLDPLALAALAETDPDEMVVSVDDMVRAVASAKAGIK